MEAFDRDIRDVHLVYDYNAEDEHGNPEKWRYELWFASEVRLYFTSVVEKELTALMKDRIVYKISGGPMAGRNNFQTCRFQCIRPGELWQCNWLEETGSIVSLLYDIPQKRLTTMLGFSQGHWENSNAAHGDKRKKADFERWREKIGTQKDRHILSEQADILESFKGRGELEQIDHSWPTL